MIRDRIRAGKGRIRKMGCDYLAYSLMDAIIDNYFVVLEDLGEKSEALQEAVMVRAEPETLSEIHGLRRELIFMRKNLWPLREVVSALEKTENKLIHRGLAPYLRDVYEHTIQVIDSVESLRDVLSGALDVYVTMVSNRTNDVMKVLTVIATIFIPLTFVAGIYGMNFEHMPELKWRFGYAGVWAVMILIAAGMMVQFKRRKWF
jgi:magnesium transporter